MKTESNKRARIKLLRQKIITMKLFEVALHTLSRERRELIGHGAFAVVPEKFDNEVHFHRLHARSTLRILGEILDHSKIVIERELGSLKYGIACRGLGFLALYSCEERAKAALDEAFGKRDGFYDFDLASSLVREECRYLEAKLEKLCGKPQKKLDMFA